MVPPLHSIVGSMSDIATSRHTTAGPKPATGTGPLAPAAPPPATREDDAVSVRSAVAAERRDTRLRFEIAARVAVAVVVLLFNGVVTLDHESASVTRLTALIGLGLNLPYLLAVRTGRVLRAQAYTRMLIDVALTTAGLYGAGGLSAAPYIGIYAIVPVYTAIVFSSFACVLAVLFATTAYLALALLQTAGVVPFLAPPPPDAWMMASFNLVVLNIVGWLAALVAHAYRASRDRLASLYTEMERAHDESVKMNTQLQLASRRYVLSEVVAGVTHEVRDALQGVFGHLWLARRGGPALPAAALDHLARAEQACEDAMRIMCTTLDMARHPTEPEREPVAVADVIRRVAQLKAVEFRRERITLRVELAETLPPVIGVSLQLQQALLNLVVNAQEEVRNSTGRREIWIAGRAEGDRVILDVRDTGRGIPADVLPHLFEPFFTTKTAGTGIGLAMSAGIAESLGGTLTGENRREGGGAAFRLTLPAATRPPLPSSAAGA
jgi:signal transduction histidine kinase